MANSNKIEINYKVLTQKKEALKTSYLKIIEIITNEDKLLARLVDEANWKGPVRNAVLDKKTEIKTQTKNITELFNKYDKYIQDVIDKYKALDKKLASDQDNYLNK